MRRTILTALLLGLVRLCAVAGDNDNIVITIDVNNPTAREVVLVSHRSLESIKLDSTGHGVDTISNVKALYASMYYGQEQRKVYLEQGDRVHITFNGNDYAGSFCFNGQKALAVDYLNTVALTSLPDSDYALTFKEYRDKLTRKEQAALRLLKARKLESVGNFVKMETGRIHYSYAVALLMYPLGHVSVAKDSTYRPAEEYYDALKAYWTEDEHWLCIDEYRDFLIELAHQLDADNRALTDLYPKNLAQISYIADNIKSDAIRQTLINSIAEEYVDRRGIKDIADLDNLYYTYVNDPTLRKSYKAKCEQHNLSAPGKPSPDFTGVDIDGNTHTLADYRGKYVYIDLWATWCGPCQKELPYLRQLEAKFKGRNITFLSLSVDHDTAKWQAKVKSGTLTGEQLLIGRDSEFQRAYNIDGIPRFILLDKQGRIVNNNMLRPSSEDIEQALSSLEGI